MQVSSPDKVIYPADAITKAEVVAHYERVGPRMLDFIAGRPLTPPPPRPLTRRLARQASTAGDSLSAKRFSKNSTFWRPAAVSVAAHSTCCSAVGASVRS